MSENELGQITDIQASSDLNESSEPEVVEFDDTPAEQEKPAEQPEPQTEKRQRTKSVSDRINQIRAESQQEIDDLKKQLEDTNSKLYEYQANEEGISLDEFMARKQSEADRLRDAINNDPEVKELRQKDFERRKQDVLTSLQKAFPKDGIEDIDHFSPDFYAMMRVGVDPVKAYKVCEMDEKKQTPPSTGSAKSEGAVSGGISEEQLKGMSTREIIDNWDKIFPG